MTVFRNYLKIQKKHLPTILMYVAICVGISVLMSMINGGNGSSFSDTEMKTALINRDHSCISDSLEAYIRGQSEMVEIGTSENDRKDAIFERKVDAVLIIPEGFGEDLMAGKHPKIRIAKVPDSMASRFIELRYNSWLDRIDFYTQAGMTQEEAVRLAEKDLEQKVSVRMVDKASTALENLKNYYNFASYGLMAALIFGTGLSMMAFRKRKVLERTISSGMNHLAVNAQMLAANLVFSVMVFLIFFICALVLYRKTACTEQGILMALNAVEFTLCISCLAFFVGTLTSKREAAIGIANIISLGSAFLCGAFVSQEMLGESVLKAGRFLPTFWYVRSNDKLALITDLAGADLSFFRNDCLMMLAFIMIFLLAAAAAERRKRS